MSETDSETFAAGLAVEPDGPTPQQGPLRGDWPVTTRFGLPTLRVMSQSAALMSKVAATRSGAREVVRV